MTSGRKEPALLMAFLLAVAFTTSVFIGLMDQSRWWLVIVLPCLWAVLLYRQTAQRECRKRVLAEEMAKAQSWSGANEIRRRMNAERAVTDIVAAMQWMCRAPGRRLDVKVKDSTCDKMVEIEHHTPN